MTTSTTVWSSKVTTFVSIINFVLLSNVVQHHMTTVYAQSAQSEFVSSRGLRDSNPRPAADSNDYINDCGGTSESENSHSFLWTLKRDPPSYFFGTVHVPFSLVWRHIPDNVKLAFHRSDNVYFELDLTDRYTVTSLANCQMLPQGEHLSSLVPPEMYSRLRRHLANVKDMMPEWMTEDQKGKGLYADYLFNAITGGWERKRPVWVMLMVNSLTESDIRARGRPVLDLYLAKEAKRLGKLVGSVEQVEEQCLPLNHLNLSQVLFALNQTLAQHEEPGVTSALPYTTDDLIHQYNCGHLNDSLISHDTAQVPNLLVQLNTTSSPDLVTASQIEHYFQQELIFKRNERMAHRITRLLKTHPRHSFFFAFGAGHFLGNNTVIDILRQRGYDIQHSPQNQPLYLGEDYEARDYPSLLADYLPESAMPGTFGELEILDPFADKRTRHRHRPSDRRRNRKKERREEKERQALEGNRENTPTDSQGLKQPLFNDLWVRLESSSGGEDPFITATKLPESRNSQYGEKQYVLYSNAPMQSANSLLIFLVIYLRTLWILL